MSRTRAHKPVSVMLGSAVSHGPRFERIWTASNGGWRSNAMDVDQSDVNWRELSKHRARDTADSEEMHVQNRERRAADHAMLRKIVKDPETADSAVWADHRRDVYGLPSW